MVLLALYDTPGLVIRQAQANTLYFYDKKFLPEIDLVLFVTPLNETRVVEMNALHCALYRWL